MIYHSICIIFISIIAHSGYAWVSHVPSSSAFTRFHTKIINHRKHALSMSTVTKKEDKVIERVKITPDGGIYKDVLTKGTGKTVETGDILAIEYSASTKDMNGVVQKPFAKNDQEKFVFKDGSMIRGWDIGVGSMRIGERAKIHIPSKYAYGAKGVDPVIAPDTDVEVDIRIIAWLGNQLNPESLFSKDLDIDPFVASTPEAIQAEFDNRQAKMDDKYKGNIFQMYFNRLKNISFGFGGSNFFASQSGERPPWWLNPNITFPSMISITLAAFIVVLSFGGVKEKGEVPIYDVVPTQGKVNID
jgi:FKBP-type peptidyl-prolyl cis-trans isomerase